MRRNDETIILILIQNVTNMRKFYSFGFVMLGQWKFSGDKHKSLQVYIERIFHQRYPLVML